MMAAAPPPGTTDPTGWAYVGGALLGLALLAVLVLVLVVIVELVTRAANRRRPDVVIHHTPATRSSGSGHAHVVRPVCDPPQERTPE